MVSTLKLALADAGETKYCHRNDYLDDTYSTVYLKLTPHSPGDVALLVLQWKVHRLTVMG